MRYITATPSHALHEDALHDDQRYMMMRYMMITVFQLAFHFRRGDERSFGVPLAFRGLRGFRNLANFHVEKMNTDLSLFVTPLF